MTRKRNRKFFAIIALTFAFVLTSAILSFSGQNSLNSNAYTAGSAPTSIGSLTFSNYETREDGGVINAAVLDKLYGAILGTDTGTYNDTLNKVKNSTSTTVGSSSDASLNNNVQIHSINFNEIAGGNPITIEFGGYKWNVVYLTTNTNENSSNGGNAGDLIATLWMAENDAAVGTKPWSFGVTNSTATNRTYAANEYGPSRIRIETLNNGNINNENTQYANSYTAQTTVSATDRAKNPYAKFTMSNSALEGSVAENTSLIDFLATPLQVEYQRAENWVWSYNGSSKPYLMPNEAWGDGTDGVTGPNINLTHRGSKGWYTNMNQVVDNTRYYEWKDDYLWLPSLTETGYNNSGTDLGTSLWGIPNENAILKSSGISWLRSGGYADAAYAQCLSAPGGWGYATSSTFYAVRPALHLNLTKAQAASKYEISLGNSISAEYDGTAKGIENEAWFNSVKDSVTVEYYDAGTKAKLDSAPVNVGSYEAVLTIKDGVSNIIWTDGKSGKSRTVSIIITPKSVKFPQFFNNINSKPYNGGEPVEFQIANYDDTIISITAPTGVTFNQSSLKVSATDVKKYILNVALKDPKNYVWETSNNKLEFEITKAPIQLKLEDSNGNKSLRGPQGSTVKAFIEVDANSSPHTGKTVLAKIMANADGLRAVEIASIDLTDTTRREEIELSLADLIENVKYTLTVVTDSAEYEINKTDTTTLDVLDSSMRTKITWNLTADGSILAGRFTDAEITDLTIAFTGQITYDGKRYGFIANPPNGYKLDETFGIGGYAVEYANNSNSAVGTNVDRYKTRIRLIRESDNDTQEYEITWEIEKAKFDLSNVKWLYDGDLPFTPGGIKAGLDMSTVPTGLIPSYSGATFDGVNVGDGGNIQVSFSLAAGYAENYIKPLATDEDSYIFTPSGTVTNFLWDINWQVVPAVIPIEWGEGQYTDKNGKPFTAPIIAGEQYTNVLTYLFYETDSKGNFINDSVSYTASEIEISENERKFYKVKPIFTNATHANNYILADVYSTHFALGDYSEGVELTLENLSLMYNAKEQAVVIKILSGSIGVNQLDIVYYDREGVTPLSEIPTNVGQYRVEIRIKEGVTGYYLTGANVSNGTAVIEYEIVERIIDNSTWINTQKPPSLKVTFAEIQGLLYEYADMDGNILTFSQLRPGNTYKVRALVKDRNNYKFKNDFNGNYYETDWVEFSVSENEQLYDPLDPNNPFYPEDPDNPNPKPGDEDGGSFIDKIKEFFEKLIESHFPLWQVITSCVALLFTLIFMIKAIQYGNRKKKAKGEAKKYNAKTYAAGLLPIFAPNIVWLNLSNMVWSIIAFSLCGVMLLMFLIALLTRRGWKKAELAKETAIEDSEQRKEAKILEREEAQENRQRELQQTIAQAAQGGQLGDSASIIEEMRREMEAREERYRQEMARRDEEQSKRDEAMKMMFANLMGRQQAEGMTFASMDDTDLLADKVFERLLPAVQQMLPEATAYLAAPSEENEELKALVEEQKALVEEQSEEIRNMTAQMTDLQEQLAAMSQERVEGVLLPDQSEEIRVLTERISELQEQLSQDRVEGILLPDQSEEMRAMAEAHNLEMRAMTEKLEELQQQLINMSQNSAETVVIPEQSEDIKALTVKMEEMQKLLLSQNNNVLNVAADRDEDDDTDDEEEEWDSILDEDDDDFVEAVIIEEDGTVKKTYPNFRMRLKQSSDKNREWYAAVKNLFCSQKGVTYRVYKRVEKIRYQGQVIAVIGIAKRSIKLWLALKPYEYDARRYHHKDVSDKPRFVDVPMYVRVSSDRALTRAQELILALFQELNMEARKRYNDRSIQELIFTLKHNKLLTNKQNKGLLCEVMHVHDCDVLSDELAEKYIESKNVESIDESYIETLKLDDIDAKFQDGNRVTLEKLKKVGLVSEDCTGYTVTAGQRLTKPLIIVANDFTLPAIKMITLTGGRAIKLNKV